MTTNLEKQIKQYEQELEKIPKQIGKVEKDIARLEAERRPLFIALHVHGNDGAKEQVDEIDKNLIGLKEALQELDLQRLQITEKLAHVKSDLQDVRMAEMRIKYDEQVSMIDDQILIAEQHLLGLGAALTTLQELTQETFNLAKSTGLDSQHVSFHRVSSYLSPRAVLVLSRLGGLNLTSSITEETTEWYREQSKI